MKKTPTLSRRAVVVGQAALAATFTASAAQARPLSRAGNTLKKARWETVTDTEMSQMIGHKFTAVTSDGTLINMKLVETEAIKSGSNRPSFLPRSEGVALVFEERGARGSEAMDQHTVQIFHKRLGGFEVLLGPVPRRSGGYFLEAVLN